jgi:hypothetical protein
VLANSLKLPQRKHSYDQYWFPFMCPGTAFWRNFHVARDALLAGLHRPHALYYDISLNNVLMACYAGGHDHDPGSGEQIMDAYARMYEDTRQAMADAAGRPVATGAEMVSELVIPYMDFYQARAEATPLSSFEADFWRPWVVAGKVEKIPLFAYVYHEYGPLRMDGWGKLAATLLRLRAARRCHRSQPRGLRARAGTGARRLGQPLPGLRRHVAPASH